MKRILRSLLLGGALLFPRAASASAREDIARLELAASRGEQSASHDLNRGLAYLQRGLSAERAPQDLGQAIAGFESARLHTGDSELKGKADAALDIARAAVAKACTARGERADFSPQDAFRLFLAGRQVALYLTCGALLASLILSVFLLRLRIGVAAAVLALAWAGTTCLAVLAVRNRTHPYAIVAPEARPETRNHIPVTGAALTQGAVLQVDPDDDVEPGWRRLRLGGQDVLLPDEALRAL